MTLRLRIEPRQMVVSITDGRWCIYGKTSRGGNMWVPRRYPKHTGSLVILTFGRVYGSFSIKDGSEIRIWEDKWLGNATLREHYPALYNIVHRKGDTIATVMESFPPNVTFRRHLVGPKLQSWCILLQRLSTVQLSHGSDVFWWNLHGKG